MPWILRIGAIAGFVAALVFRRNIGAEVSLFTGIDAIPANTAQWLALLRTNPFVGLSFLAFFDIINYALLTLVFIALCANLSGQKKSIALAATALGIAGILLAITSNISLPMLSLSGQFARSASATEQSALLSTGQALLASHDPLAEFPGFPYFIGFLLVALSSLLFSLLMFANESFGRVTTTFGILAATCDVVYCSTLPFLPSLRALWGASGGLFYMIWHILIARKLWIASSIMRIDTKTGR